MPTFRKRPNGTYFIDFRLDGQRRREQIKTDTGAPETNEAHARAIYDGILARWDA